MNRFIRTALTLLFASTAMATSSNAAPTHTALFAGGCFWCMQPSFDNTNGVTATSVGYAGGTAETATYEQVSSGTTKHLEVIQVTYDPSRVSYEKLLETYLENIDPTQEDGQFADRGPQYHTAIFYADAAQKEAAEKALARIAAKFAPAPIKVTILPVSPFYAAEDYHQRYYEKNALRYNAYKHGSGRAGYIERVWKKKDK